ncbi:MAG: chlorite dismutase family protein [Nitrospirales bacterium]|nr:chlorite dismutase family protein [Nitrospirales bacterium]MDR4485787.1 chlorite dismutase family protein [Nitrospirales bacterium]
MRALLSLLFFAIVQVGFSGLSWAADTPIFATFALFDVDNDWGNSPMEERQKSGEEAKALLESFKNQVTVDGYWTYGLTTDSHFMLRLHSADLKANQQLLTHLRGTSLGRHLALAYTISGVTKGLNYAPGFPDLLEKLKGAKYEGDPSTYAVMIPIRKSAEWWNLPKEDRVALMKEHTLPTVAYLKTVKRKLYHSTGLSDVDFLTIFETNNLVDFNDLVIALRMVREDTFNVQLGEPTIIGTLKNWNDIVDLLVK